MVARQYGHLKQRLKQKGRPLPESDVWIAATAKQHGMVLVTRHRHFQEVEDLDTAHWAFVRNAAFEYWSLAMRS